MNLLDNSVQVVENESILSVRFGDKINLYSIESGELRDSVIIDNSVFKKIHHAFLLDTNHLVFFNKYNNQIMVVDKKMNLILKDEIPSIAISKDSIMSYYMDKSVDVRPDKLTNGLIGIKLSPYFNFNVSESEYFSWQKNQNVYSNAVISFEPFKVKMIGHYPEAYLDLPRKWNGLEYSSTLRIIDSMNCIQCLSLINTCYLHNLVNNKTREINFQSNFTSIPPKTSSMFPSLDKTEYVTTVQKYNGLHINQKTKKIYRIVQHEMPIKDVNGNYQMQGENNWSIIEYDQMTEQFKEYYFEGKHYSFSNILPFRDGLLISNQGVNNKYYDPNKTSYSYFTFE